MKLVICYDAFSTNSYSFFFLGYSEHFSNIAFYWHYLHHRRLLLLQHRFNHIHMNGEWANTVETGNIN